MKREPTIRPAGPHEVSTLPQMQVEAGQLFHQLGMALVAEGPLPEVVVFARAQRAGRLLVAVDDDRVVGFALIGVIDDTLHLDQVTVAPTYGSRGTGRRLMLAVEDHARATGHHRITLTTFRDVSFNGPFYESMGWRAQPDDTLTPGLAALRKEEAEAGLDAWPRQAMVRHL